MAYSQAMISWIGLSLAVVAAVVGWLFAILNRARQTDVKARLDAALRELAEKGQALDSALRDKTKAEQERAVIAGKIESQDAAFAEARKSLSDTFAALAADALGRNNDTFLSLAKQQLGEQQDKAKTELSAKETAIEGMLKPVRETLDKLQTDTRELEKQRAEAYGAVLTEIRNLQQTHGDLRRETTQLVQALRAPKTRGSWGELQLRKCIEFAGMVEHCTFEKEVYVPGTPDGEDSQRPDVVVQLPNQRCIVIDAKTPLEAFLEAVSTEDETVRADKLKLHAMQVRKHLEQLHRKRYWERLEHAADFVVCFLPSEVLFSAALEADPSLIEYGARDNVVLATPTTLISLLRAVAIGWQQTKLTENARAIQETGLSLYRKLTKTHEYLLGVGKGIRDASKKYDDLINIIEGRGGVFSQARKLRELGVGDEDLDVAIPLTIEPRELRSEDWSPASEPLALAAVADNDSDTGPA